MKPDGFALYSLYWYKFMTGELDELSDILYRMLSDNNYFLRVFAIKELHRLKKIEISADHQTEDKILRIIIRASY